MIWWFCFCIAFVLSSLPSTVPCDPDSFSSICPFPLLLRVFCLWGFLYTVVVSPQPFLLSHCPLYKDPDLSCMIKCLILISAEKQKVRGIAGRYRKGLGSYKSLPLWCLVCSSLLNCKLEVPLNFSCVWSTLALLKRHWAHLLFPWIRCFPAPQVSWYSEELCLNFQGFLGSGAHATKFLVHRGKGIFKVSS